MTGEATDLVARLRDVPEMLRWYGDLGTGRIVAAETLTEAATLIEAQAAEIEEATRLLERFDKEWNSGSGWAIRMDDLGDEVRAFLASRTERADG